MKSTRSLAAAASFSLSLAALLTLLSLLGATPASALPPDVARPSAIGGRKLAIHDVQGAAHVSPLAGARVTAIEGIVTVVRSNGFFLQDPLGDDDPATSEALFVYTGGPPGVAVGDALAVDGEVKEYFPGGLTAGNLPTTELVDVTFQILSTGNPLPAPVVVGLGGRIPPSMIIDNDCSGDVTTGLFDPDEDGIDFYESLEAMLLQISDAQVVGPTNSHGEIAVVADRGAHTTHLSARGSLALQPSDFNPERIILDDVIISSEPKVPVGTLFSAPIVGVLDYSYGNFKLLNIDPLPSTAGSLISETAIAPLPNELRVASFNLLNLDPNPSDGDNDAVRFAGLAHQIVNHLLSPDIIGVQEVQDNSGTVDDGVVDASLTFATLIPAITAAGGPAYDHRQIDPLDNQDGGVPGGNIRVGFLFRADRGVEFVDRPGGDATTPVSLTLGTGGVELSISPGRINPHSPAWLDSRKPLAAEFTFQGHKFILIVAHFNSKTGDDPLFGWAQPPAVPSEAQRIQQAAEVSGFVGTVLALDPDANIVVLGDLNDYPFSTAVSETLAADLLVNLWDTRPLTERYSYLHDGNAQALDHILVNHTLSQRARVTFDVIHLNAEYPATKNRPSDHDPVIASIRFGLQLYLPVTHKSF